MDCVKLYFKDTLIGVLTYNDQTDKYMFIKNKFFNNKYIEDVMGLSDKEVYISKSLFSFFLVFLKKYGNEEYDHEYNELIKIAGLNIDKNQFWIGA